MLILENADFVVASDLHLENGGFSWSSRHQGKVLLLCGDIIQVNLWDSPSYKDMFDHFFETVSSQFEIVLYVLGNHEYYGSTKEEVVGYVRQKLKAWPNVHLLDNEHIDIDGVRYIGSTLWASANNTNPLTMMHLRNIREFSVIRSNAYMIQTQEVEYEFDEVNNKPVLDSKGYRVEKSRKTKVVPDKMGVQGMVEMHMTSVAYLEQALQAVPQGMPVVVLTHHAPSLKSVRPPFNKPDSYHLNGMFASNCDELIERYKPVVWVHGHLHNKIGYKLNDTLVVVSTKGYSAELLTADWQPTGVSLKKTAKGVEAVAFNARGLLNYDQDTGHLVF